jgi:hypothetical protein
MAPDGRTIKQIDHIIINGKWRRSLQDVRAYWGADAYSDHHLIAATIKLKLEKSIPKSHRQRKLDIAKLQYPKKNKEFVLELGNRFSTPEASSEMVRRTHHKQQMECYQDHIHRNSTKGTSEREQEARWVQHFQEVLNLPEPEQRANITTTEDTLEINTNPPESAEVKAAIQTLKMARHVA